MDRRALLSFVPLLAGSSAAAALARSEPAGDAVDRPTLSIDPDGADGWRIRSWELEGSAWRPVVAHATTTPGGARVVTGRIAALDREAVRAWLAASSTA
ncbi:hypothetical protein [Sphingomonas sp. 3-13AW]|jgi:hypothetical protein|uniref:hypothetical protein n=1 Tax=Sphingomonas sp. 3-13AW TaxID=3050450 RepID=UPI003BB4DA70